MGKKNSKQAEQVLIRGPETAKHFILIEFCGGWGYYKHADVTANRIEAKYPGMFKIELRKDRGTTGRLEVTIFHSSQDSTSNPGNALVVHAKSKG